MEEYIERKALREAFDNADADIVEEYGDGDCDWGFGRKNVLEVINSVPAADVAPMRHGKWLLQANNEITNYRWNVTAECSECCDEKKEIWAGFFPNVPDWLARDVALESAKSVRLSNYCPNCGAIMDGKQ